MQGKTKIRQHFIRLEMVDTSSRASAKGFASEPEAVLVWLESGRMQSDAVAKTGTCAFGGFACGGQQAQAGASHLTSSKSYIEYGHVCESAAEPRRATTTCAPAASEGKECVGGRKERGQETVSIDRRLLPSLKPERPRQCGRGLFL